MKRKRSTLIRAVAYVGVAAAIYGASSGNALAWGAWGSWKGADQQATCSHDAGPPYGYHYPCTGTSMGTGTLIAAHITGGGNIAQCQAEGQYVGGTTFVTDNWETWPAADSSTAAWAGGTISRHHCRCHGTNLQ